ncbi:hypothetical protein BGZ98_010358 [Dissophora globulifera]|nr:hypothetical protein BGZ98_010358 [Dissophora globulifera]
MALKNKPNQSNNPHQSASPSTTSQTALALAIPEILMVIALFLNRHSLTNCARVCKGWKAVFQPQLFSVICAADFDLPGFVHAFQNNIPAVTSIEWIQESLPRLPASSKESVWRHIYRTTALFGSSSSSPSSRTLATLNLEPFVQLEQCLLAEPMPSLKSLSVRVQNNDPNCILRLATTTIVNLQISTTGYRPMALWPLLYMEDILEHCPNLVHLTLEGIFTLGSRSLRKQAVLTPGPAASLATAVATTAICLNISSPFPSPFLGPHTSPSSLSAHNSAVGVWNRAAQRPSSIESLTLRQVNISQDELLALRDLLPKLKSVLIEELLTHNEMIRTYYWTWSPTFTRSLRTAFPHIQSLRLAFMFEIIEEKTIVEILQSFPLLTTVGFRNARFGQRAMEALQQHCKLVECLDVSLVYGDERFKAELNAELLHFLQTWPHLRELEAEGVIFHIEAPIRSNVIRKSWACTKLEKLVCGFQGTESTIFQHLSQFPMLWHLMIVHPSLIISSVDTTLAWMARSTKIEYFWFKQQHGQLLKKGTIEWFLKHWPNLKKLHVAGGAIEQKKAAKKWRREAQRLGVDVEINGC